MSLLCRVAGEKQVMLWPATYHETGQARQCTGSGNLEGRGGTTVQQTQVGVDKSDEQGQWVAED